MRRIICNIFSVFYTFIKLIFLKLFHFKSLKFSIIERFSPSVVIELEKKSLLSFGRKVRIHSGCKIKVRKGAQLIIEDDVKINYNCMFIAKKSIKIGSGTEFGPNVLIYDHDHDYKKGLKKNEFKAAKVEIGKNCWIGANTIILKGVTIGENCVIAAGSIVNCDVNDNTVFIQKRISDEVKYEQEI